VHLKDVLPAFPVKDPGPDVGIYESFSIFDILPGYYDAGKLVLQDAL